MVSCKLAEFFYGLVPLAGFRNFLLRVHMEGCPFCEKSLVSRDQARTLFVGPEGLETDPDLWTRIRARSADERTGPRGRRLRLEWATGAAGVLVLAVAGFWLLRNVGPNGAGSGSGPIVDRFEIESINVGGAPAQAYVYQPGDTDMIFVWAEKSDQGG
jgi:hypothetical protein